MRSARAALRHECTLFDMDAANWRDVRTATDGTPEGPSYPALWCHGAGGVGLARLGLMRDGVLPREEGENDVAAAVSSVDREGFGRDFSLCHGDFGNLDFLLQAAPEAAWRRAPGILDALDSRGWVCGLPADNESPSLMVGVAGIGHGLLRLAAADLVPSVPALEPPRVTGAKRGTRPGDRRRPGRQWPADGAVMHGRRPGPRVRPGRRARRGGQLREEGRHVGWPRRVVELLPASGVPVTGPVRGGGGTGRPGRRGAGGCSRRRRRSS